MASGRNPDPDIFGHGLNDDHPDDSDLDELSAPELRAIIARERQRSSSLRDAVQRARLAKRPKALSHALEADLERVLDSLDAGVHWRDSDEVVQVLYDWLDSVGSRVLPAKPDDAARLALRFVESDQLMFEAIDDSHGEIGAIMREACDLYLNALAVCADDQTSRLEKIIALHRADDYGAREHLLANAAKAVEPKWLLAHAREQLAFAATSRNADIKERESRRIPREAIEASLIAQALRDPQLSVDATLLYAPTPNEQQRAGFVADFLRFGQASGALAWLEGPWEDESRRLDLLAQTHAALGDVEQAANLLEKRFRAKPDVYALSAWLDVLPASGRDPARIAALEAARRKAGPLEAANLLALIEDWQTIEAIFVDKHAAIDGDAYYDLLPIAQALERNGHLLGATLAYRALIESILTRAKAKTYHHGADYWRQLQVLSKQAIDFGRIETPAQFVSRIRKQHGRKPAFWARVDAAGG